MTSKNLLLYCRRLRTCEIGISISPYSVCQRLLDKVTLESLKAHLWKASDILRGSLDASEYRQPVMTLLFLKRLNDRFEENVEELVGQGKSEEGANLEFYHDFFVPDGARWKNLQEARKKSRGKR